MVKELTKTLTIAIIATALSACGPQAPIDSDADAGSVSGEEPCGDGFDDDVDGIIDEDCTCGVGDTQPCHPDVTIAGVGACVFGVQTCEGGDEFGEWGACEGAGLPTQETCNDEGDENCDGMVDEDCPCLVQVNVNLNGDCVTTSCPPEAPYPVACNITMSGGDHRGCVASTPTNSVVYFQEGNACGAGSVTGTLSCSCEPGVGLTESTCSINKPTRYYPDDRNGCPVTSG